jgi:putative ABC transport system permease protein
MNWLARLRGRLSVDADLREEMSQHLEERIEALVQEGYTLEAARGQARREFGSVALVAEQGRDVWAFTVIEDTWRDVRQAIRQLAHAPGFAAAVVLTLAIGTGAMTAVYSLIDATFFKPLPFAEPERLVRLRVPVPLDLREAAPARRAQDGDLWSGSDPIPIVGRRGLDITDLWQMPDVFAGAAAYAIAGLNFGGTGEPVRVQAAYATTGFFAVLGRTSLIGRTFGDEDGVPGSVPVAILSHGLWLRSFGADQAVLGTSVTFNGIAHDVIGVMPESFRRPAEADVWLPLPVPAPLSLINEAFRNTLSSVTVARLALGVTRTQATDRLVAMMRADPTIAPADSSGLITPLQQTMRGDRESGLKVLMASASLVLLIACVNVSGLFLARASRRTREFATRLALGATKGRMIRQLVVEHLLLAGLGAVLGVLLAASTLRVLIPLMPPALDGLSPPTVDWRVLGFALGVTMMGSAAAGLVASWRAIRALQNGPPRDDSASGARRRLANGFVVAETATACVLLIGSGLMIGTLRALTSVDVGMDTSRIATARLTLPSRKYGTVPPRASFIEAVVTTLASAPGVEQAAAINTLPFGFEGGIFLPVAAQGRTSATDGEPLGSAYLVVSPGYFQTMGIPFLAGRDFSWTDGRERRVAIVNDSLARALWPGENPLGSQLVFAGPRTVVGVVQDALQWDVKTAAEPQVYVPIQDSPQSYLAVVARAAPGNTPDQLLPHLGQSVRSVDSEVPIYAAQSLDALVAEAIATPRGATGLISVFGTIALVLAGIGVYSVLSYSVSQRTREIGLRLALGAQPSTVIAMILRQGVALAAGGAALGLLASWAAIRFLESLLFGIAPHDPRVMAVAVLVLLAAATAAAWLPARRAARVDPVTALRTE